MKALTIITVTLVLILAGLGAGGYYLFSQAKEKTMPIIEQESLEDYAINIGNSLVNNRELEVPPEILSYIISEKTGVETACVVTSDSRLEIWFSEEIEYIGKTDICFTVGIESYDKDTGELVLSIEEIHVGKLLIPEILKNKILQAANGFANEKVNISKKYVKLVIDKITTEFMGVDLVVNIDSVKITNGKLFFGLYTELDMNLFFKPSS